MPHLSALYVYPVKSCRGVALAEAVLDHRGLIHDREFMVVDAEDRHLTQRATPALAHVATAIGEEGAAFIGGRRGANFACRGVRRAA